MPRPPWWRRSIAVAVLVVLGFPAPSRPAVPPGAVALEPCPDEMPFPGLLLTFAPRDPAGLDELIREQLDPASPRYRAWLSPEEFGERFGPPAADYEAAAAWLRARFANVRTWPGRLAIGFDGSAGAVAAAFGRPLQVFAWQDRVEVAPAGDPALPVFGGTRPRGILGLDGFVRVHPQLRVGSADRLAPADVHTIFGLDQLYAAGTTGAGVTIALLAVTDFQTSDVELFRSTFGLPAVTLTKRGPGLGHFGSASEIGEALLDTEWSGAIAPGASLVAEVATGTEIGALATAWLNAVNTNVAAVVSISFGACEPLVGADLGRQLDGIAAQAAAQGQSVVVSSGDSGASDCVSIVRTMPEPAVNALAASPSVTAVGGTRLTAQFDAAGDATGYGGEVVWNESASGGGATGGGRSIIFAKPLYQSGPGVPDDGARDLPDVAFAASPRSPGFLVIGGGTPTPVVVGGTSASAPVWGGLIALLAQRAGGRVGLVNPELYRLGRRQTAGSGPAVFHDVTAGTNDWPSAPGFAAGPGFDLATGWGSFDAPALLAAFGQCAADAECDDGLPCTTDVCTPQGCSNAPLPDGTACAPDDPCVVRSCAAGACAAGASRCDDGDPCTADTCDLTTGCAHAQLVDVAGVVCRIPTGGLETPECAGQPVPRAASAQLESARQVLLRAAGAGARKRRRLIAAGERRLRRALRTVQRALRRDRIDDACAASLRGVIQPIADGAAEL